MGNFISGMHLKKGALHKSLGVPQAKKIPPALIDKKLGALKKKSKGDKKLSASEIKLSKRLTLAKTFSQMRHK